MANVRRLGQYTIEQIQPQADGTPSKIKVKVRLNRNGIFDVTQASLIETIEEPNAPAGVEETMETAAPGSQVGDSAGDQNPPPSTEPMDEVSRRCAHRFRIRPACLCFPLNEECDTDGTRQR